MGLKSDVFSNEIDPVAVASQHSVNEDKTGDSLQHIEHDASNLLCVNSNHDSYSDNIESKATTRPSDVSDELEDVGIQRTFSNKYYCSKSVEGHGDNISCASRASDADKMDLDIKHSSLSVCSLGSEKVLSSQKLGLSELLSVKEEEAGSNPLSMQSPYSQSGKVTIGGSSEISSKVPKSETNIDNNSGDPLDNGGKSLNEGEQDESTQLVELPDKPGSPLQALSGDESYESDPSEVAIGGSSEISSKIPKSEANIDYNSGDSLLDNGGKSLNEGEQDEATQLVELPDKPESPLQAVSGDESYESDPSEVAIGGSSEISSKIRKSEANIDNNSGGSLLDNGGKKLNEGEQDESTQLVELPDKPESPLQELSGDESSELDPSEDDVEVCDICGDAGQEDLLAICSKCSDGAEHTYCMREMRQKVPEGYWLCEECKLAEETENQKQGLDVEGEKENKLRSTVESLARGHSVNLEGDLSLKRKVVETSMESPKSPSPSMQSSDKGKVKPYLQNSFGNQSGNDMRENVRPPTSDTELQTTKGDLLKSNSFNTSSSEPKVKLVDEVVLQKQKSAREHASLDSREELGRRMDKSMSCKSTNSGQLNARESNIKTVLSKFPHVQDLKGLKKVRERISLEKRSFSKLDRLRSTVSIHKVDQKLTPRADTSSHSSASNKRKTKVVQSDGKHSILSRSTNNLAHKGVESAVTSAVVVPSANGPISSEEKLNQLSQMEEPSSSSSWTAEKQPSNFDGVMSDGLSQSKDSTNHSEKSRENIYKGDKLKAAIEAALRLRPGIRERASHVPSSISNKAKSMVSVEGIHGQENLRNQAPISNIKLLNPYSTDAVSATSNGPISSKEKLNQLSQVEEPSSSSSWTAEKQPSNFDGVMSDGLSQSKDSTNHSEKSRENIYKGDKLKAAIEAAIRLRPGIRERASHVPSSISNRAKSMISVEGIHDGQENLRNQAPISNIKLLNPYSTDAVSATSSIHNPSMREISVPPLALGSSVSKISAIPKLEYIWQGAFEVHTSGKPPGYSAAIQAHLSTLASPKVLEVVNTFPHKVSLNEVPRLSTWPTHFHDTGPKEDNIALYFFARDLRSYENYKVLLDTMVKNDFALKGAFEGVELLIFPSNQLPENCQRWNALLFLWGVFKRRANSSTSIKSVCIPDASMVHLERGISIDITQPVANRSGACDSTCGVVPLTSAVEKACISTDRVGDNKVSSCERAYVGIATSSNLVHPEIKCSSPLEVSKVADCRSDTELKPCLQATETDCGSVKVEIEEMHVRDGDYVVGKIDGGSVKIRDSMDDSFADGKTSSKRHLDCWQPNHHKRSYSDLTETVSENCTDTSQKITWSEVKRVSIGGGSDNKKLKTGFSEKDQYINVRDQCPTSYSLVSDTHDPCTASAGKEERCDIAWENKVIPDDMGSNEEGFFPVVSHHARELQLGGLVHDASPNLELALGAETGPQNKELSHVFVGTVDKNNDHDRVTGKEEDDAPTSLSLSFPFPEK